MQLRLDFPVPLNEMKRQMSTQGSQYGMVIWLILRTLGAGIFAAAKALIWNFNPNAAKLAFLPIAAATAQKPGVDCGIP